MYLFEPSAAHMALAKQSVTGNVLFFDVALADGDRAATLYKNADVTSLASLTKRDLGWREIRMDLTESVQVRALDSVFADEHVDFIDLLKIDVEGHELDVLSGACDTLASGRVRFVQFEFGGCNIDTKTHLRDFFRFFEKLRYSLYLVRPHGKLLPLPEFREIYEQYTTTNYLAVRPGEKI